jgi:serine/threonine-protein kinase
MVFLFKAGTLSGWFYVAAVLCFVGAIPMAILGPPWSPLLFGAISAVGFFVPGLKYYRQRLQSMGK